MCFRASTSRYRSKYICLCTFQFYVQLFTFVKSHSLTSQSCVIAWWWGNHLRTSTEHVSVNADDCFQVSLEWHYITPHIVVTTCPTNQLNATSVNLSAGFCWLFDSIVMIWLLTRCSAGICDREPSFENHRYTNKEEQGWQLTFSAPWIWLNQVSIHIRVFVRFKCCNLIRSKREYKLQAFLFCIYSHSALGNNDVFSEQLGKIYMTYIDLFIKDLQMYIVLKLCEHLKKKMYCLLRQHAVCVYMILPAAVQASQVLPQLGKPFFLWSWLWAWGHCHIWHGF